MSLCQGHLRETVGWAGHFAVGSRFGEVKDVDSPCYVKNTHSSKDRHRFHSACRALELMSPLFHSFPFSAPYISSVTSYLLHPDCGIGVEFYITTQEVQKLLLSINFTCFCVLINAYLQYRFGLGLYFLITILSEIGWMRFCPCGPVHPHSVRCLDYLPGELHSLYVIIAIYTIHCH